MSCADAAECKDTEGLAMVWCADAGAAAGIMDPMGPAKAWCAVTDAAERNDPADPAKARGG